MKKRERCQPSFKNLGRKKKRESRERERERELGMKITQS